MDDRRSRRDVLRTLGAALVAVPVIGCGDDSGPGDAAADSPGDASGSRWASGGTAAMTDAASYPDPFVAAASCAFFADATLGPCYTTAPIRRDVSEGYPGLPVRLALQILDGDCAPLAGARVEIWHTRNAGSYSEGPTSACTRDDVDARTHTFFRGGQVTDADGKVNFDTCLPGWYAGRAVHVHLQVFLADGATASKISQLFFPPDLIREVFASHPDYSEFGQPDTSNASDGVYPDVGEAGVVDYERMTDGAMLAWKRIRVA